MPPTVATLPTRRKSARDPISTLVAAHPFAADDVAHALRWRFGEFLRAPRKLKTLLQAHFLERFAGEAPTWRRDSVTAYTASKQRAIDATAGLVAKFEAAAALVPLDATEADIRTEAMRRAELMHAYSKLRPPELGEETRANLAARCRALGVVPPADDPRQAGYVCTAPAIARMVCALWWRKRLRVHQVGAIGAAYRELGRVSAGRELYVSDATVRRRREQLEANARAAAAAVMESESGRRMTRAQAIAASVSNPTVRAAELMTRISGVESWAEENGFVALFLTLTAPSRMHRRTQSADGRAIFDNAGFDPAWSAPRRIHREYFAPLWSRVRSALQRLGVPVFGTRSVEPHHDGTPHWHLMLFCPPANVDAVCELVRGYALQDAPGEPGAAEHRCRIKQIPIGFVGAYVAKYVLELARADDMVTPALQASEPTRAAAWAWENRIRQFQFFGVAEVGVWRELRRLQLEVRGMPNPQLVNAPQALRDAALAAQRITSVDPDTGEVTTLKPADFGDYICANGGCGGRRADRPLSVARVQAEQLTRYGETRRDPVGVLVVAPRLIFDAQGELLEVPDCRLIESLRERWRLVEFIVPAVPERAARARPWACVNNCTGAAAPDAPQSERGPPLGSLWAPAVVPFDRLDEELARAIAAARDPLASAWYWPRSAVVTARPLTPAELERQAEAADLRADYERSRARLAALA